MAKKNASASDLMEGQAEAPAAAPAPEVVSVPKAEWEAMQAQMTRLSAALEGSQAKAASAQSALDRSGIPLSTQKVIETPLPDDLDSGPRIGEVGEYLPAKYVTRRGNIRQDN